MSDQIVATNVSMTHSYEACLVGLVGWMVGWLVGWMDGWMDGLTDGWLVG